MPTTTIEVRYPPQKGRLTLRGSVPPLSWYEDTEPIDVDEDRILFEVEMPVGAVFEFKLKRDGTQWSCGRNIGMQAGERKTVHPYFEKSTGSLDASHRVLQSDRLERDMRYRVFLPPSYDEHEELRYPVLYAQDGQSLFSDTRDPIDGQSWRLDDALNELYDLGAAEEVIVVAVLTDVDRLELLSPWPDPVHGGGKGPDYLEFLVDELKPVVDGAFRTSRSRADTGVMGASMGGLFAFFAAWTRPNVFGRAICLSSSFWWSERAMVREVQKGVCPYPPPVLYLDSGAARSPFEEDANLRDGHHHTVALRRALVSHCYEPGEDLHTLAFAGMSHNNGSWASRLAIPLQLIYPQR